MNPLTYIENMTAEDVQRYARIALQWLAAYLVTHGTIKADATWVEPTIGFAVGFISLLWTLYGNRLNAKLAEIAKVDTVKKVVVTDNATAAAVPSPKVTTT